MSNTQNTPRLGSGALLWASAVVVAALIIVQGGRLVGGAPARADLVSGLGAVTVMTVEGQSEDTILVADNRSEELMVYKVVNQNSLELFRTYNLSRLFSEARSRATGGRR